MVLIPNCILNIVKHRPILKIAIPAIRISCITQQIDFFVKFVCILIKMNAAAFILIDSS